MFDIIIDALVKTYSGTSEEIAAAYQTLMIANEEPDYPTLLINIIISQDLLDLVRIAASIQLKQYFNQHIELVSSFSLEEFTNILLYSPPTCQLQFKNIITQFITVQIDQDNIQTLLDFTRSLLSNVSTFFIGVLFLRCIMKTRNQIIHGVGERKSLYQLISPFFNDISEFILSNQLIEQNKMNIHVCLLASSMLCNHVCPQPIENWISIIQNVAEVYNGDLSYPCVEKDAYKLAVSLIEIYRENILLTQIYKLYSLLINTIPKCKSDSAKAYAYRFMNIVFMMPEMWELIKTNICLVFLDVFIPIHFLTEEDINIINDDLYSFLISQQMVKLDNKIPLHESCLALISLLSQNINAIEIFSNLFIEEFIKALNNSRIEHLYGYIHLIIPLLGNIDHNVLSQLIIFILNIIPQLFTINNDIAISSAFQILGYIPLSSNELDYLYFAFDTILSYKSLLIKYSACISVGNILPQFQDYKTQIVNKYSANLIDVIQTSMTICQNIQTDEITSSIKNICYFFFDEIKPISNEMIYLLFNTMQQYCMDDECDSFSDTFNNCAQIIINFSIIMKNESQDFYFLAITLGYELLAQIESNKYKPVLKIIDQISKDAPVINDSFFMIFHNIQYINYQIDIDIFQLVVSIIKSIIIKSIDIEFTQNIYESVFNLCNYGLNQLNDGLSYKPCLIIMMLLFITMKKSQLCNDYFTSIYEFFQDNLQQYYGDFISTLVYYMPKETLQNDYFYKTWIKFSSPAIFLLSAIQVLDQWSTLPEYIQNNEEVIQARIEECKTQFLEEVNALSEKPIENNMKFDFDDDLRFDSIDDFSDFNCQLEINMEDFDIIDANLIFQYFNIDQ